MSAERRIVPKPELNFNADCVTVADQLVDAKFKVGDKTVTVTETKWFAREENEQGKYRVVLGLKTGLLVGVSNRGSVLPLVTAIGGGCVKLHSAEITAEDGKVIRVNGHPGIIARELGLEKGQIREIVVEDPHSKVLRLG